MTINERIRHLRKDVLKLNQTDFASAIGMKQRGASGMEQDGATVTGQATRAISLAFNVNEEWLRTGEGEMFLQADTFSLDQYLKDHGCTALEKEIVKAYFDLDMDTRQKVFELFDHFHARLEAAREQLAADTGQQEVQSPQEMTVAELHAELDRQIAEEKKRAASGSVSGPGSSETATG